jgi:serine/threonine-protein kinase
MQPGDLVGDRFRLDHVIGSGGMGVVYLARDQRERRRVAVKVLVADADDENTRRRFLREAWAVSQLSHPCIVQVFDHGETTDGTPWIAMEFIDGTSFGAMLERGRLPVREVTAALAPMARALAAAHRAGFVHRDVKPDNILVRGDGRPVLVDFGITRTIRHVAVSAQTEHLTATGMLVGTPEYMSPEQVRGAPLDGRSDQFSLAVVCYEALTGRRPFEGESTMAIFAAVVADEAPRVDALAPSVPRALCDAVARALSKRPGDRFEDLDDFADVLEAFIPTDFHGIDLRRFEPPAGDDAYARGTPTMVDLDAEHPRAEPTTEPRQLCSTTEGLDTPQAIERSLVEAPDDLGPDESAVRTVVRMPRAAAPDVETERLDWIPRMRTPYRPLETPPVTKRPSPHARRLVVLIVLCVLAVVIAVLARR